MSALQANTTEIARYGLSVVLILSVALLVSLIIGLDLSVLVWLVSTLVSIGLVLAFLYLFYRLVVAVEQIANRI